MDNTDDEEFRLFMQAMLSGEPLLRFDTPNEFWKSLDKESTPHYENNVVYVDFTRKTK